MYKVYRYEKDNEGPYSAYYNGKYNELKNMMDTHNNSEIHPGIYEDSLIRNLCGGICACHSIKDLLLWFSDYTSLLVSLGFKIYEYTVVDIKKTKSGRQLSFSKRDIINKIIIN